ncbi:unnamed protein product [Lymnaea stagnalis]|uniref:VWFA domain-containing protein n=1 Tax=Lymnaea stagnalis TaxID=6523 RepID=A0AAV2HMC3_LYMST
MTGPCKQAADIIFVVDTSSSIWPVHFNKHVKTFLKDVIASFNIGPGPLDTRVGILLFSTREYLEFHLNTYEVLNDTLKAVDAIRFRGGDTYTNKALEYAARTMLTSEHGAREGVAKLLVVLTDGRSANKKKTEDAAKALKARGRYRDN